MAESLMNPCAENFQDTRPFMLLYRGISSTFTIYPSHFLCGIILHSFQMIEPSRNTLTHPGTFSRSYTLLLHIFTYLTLSVVLILQIVNIVHLYSCHLLSFICIHHSHFTSIGESWFNTFAYSNLGPQSLANVLLPSLLHLL